MAFTGHTSPLFKSARDRSFMKSLKEFIKSEKEHLCCPAKGPDEQRYNIYSTAFEKITDYATAYKPILTGIKKEYDDFIKSVKNVQHQAQRAHGKQKAMLAQPISLMYYHSRAAQLQERIASIQRNTADLHTEIKRLQKSKSQQKVSQQKESTPLPAPIGRIPGLTLSESLNPEDLEKHLESLVRKRNQLLNKKRSEYVPVEVQRELDVKIKAILHQRDELFEENNKLLLRHTQLTHLKEALGRWGESRSRTSLLQLLSSELKHVAEIKVSEDDHTCFHLPESENVDPGQILESKRLARYVESFVTLFESGDYVTAACHAATSPHGVLRDINVLEKFNAITAYKGAVPPVLLFFRLLMISAPPGKPLAETLSLVGVRCALQHGCVELVTFGVSQHRLTYTEELGDLICRHGDGDLRVTDTCLALAQIVYSACGVLRKAALSMCKRGLTAAAVDFIYYNKEFTIDDCVFILKELPSVALLQEFTRPCDATPPLMSVGFICHYLLNTDLEDLAFNLLEQIQAEGQGALEKTILEDEMSSVENWSEISARCEQTDRLHLAQDITSTLLLQDGVVRLSSGLDGAELMEHVFM